MRAERGRITVAGMKWWERARKCRFGGRMGSCEMVELRGAMIDEIEVVFKEFIEKYDGEVRWGAIGMGSGGMPSYFPDEWSRRWPILRGLR